MRYEELEKREIELTNKINNIFEQIIKTNNKKEKQDLREMHDMKAKELREVIKLKNKWLV